MLNIAAEIFSFEERWNKWMLDEPPWQGHSSLSSSRYLKHGGGSAPLIFFPSVSAAAVCHADRCACTLVPFAWWLHLNNRQEGEENGLNTPLLTLIYFFFPLSLPLIKLHVSLNLNCFFGEPAYVIWFAIFGGNGLYYFDYQGKSDRGTRDCHNLAFSTFEGGWHSWKDTWITFVKEEKRWMFLLFFLFLKSINICSILSDLQQGFSPNLPEAWSLFSHHTSTFSAILFPPKIESRLVDSRWVLINKRVPSPPIILLETDA